MEYLYTVYLDIFKPEEGWNEADALSPSIFLSAFAGVGSLPLSPDGLQQHRWTAQHGDLPGSERQRVHHAADQSLCAGRGDFRLRQMGWCFVGR